MVWPKLYFHNQPFLAIPPKLVVSLKRLSFRKLILEEAKNEIEELRKTLEGRFMFIKMDAATRQKVNYFAINATFVYENKKMGTRTLGVVDSKAHHGSINLQNFVEEILQDFEIKKDQILCIVTDNVLNMLSTIERINKVEIKKSPMKGRSLKQILKLKQRK